VFFNRRRNVGTFGITKRLSSEKSWGSYQNTGKPCENLESASVAETDNASYENAVEYYHFGHDGSEPLFDSKLGNSLESVKNLCFIGIGDGRNLFATLLSIANHERATTQHSKYHITINDINPCAIARLLLFFQILNDMALAKAKGSLGM